MLRRSAPMAGNSISGSFPHSFHQGRGGGGTGGWNFQSRGLQNLTKRHARQQRIGRLPNTGKAKKTPTPNPHRPTIRGTNSRSHACLSGSTYDSAHSTQNGLRAQI